MKIEDLLEDGPGSGLLRYKEQKRWWGRRYRAGGGVVVA
jgi:hypothetical protein